MGFCNLCTFLLWLTLNGHFNLGSDGYIIIPSLLPKLLHHHHHDHFHHGGRRRRGYPLFVDSSTDCEVLETSTPKSTSSPSSRTEFIRRVDEYLEDISREQNFDSRTWRESIHDEIQQDFERDRQRFQWLLSSSTSNDGGSTMDRQHQHQIETEWIYVPKKDEDEDERRRPLALRTLSPILDDTTIDLLRCVADEYWRENESDSETLASSSLFTYQRKGNQEAHLGDLCSYNTTLKDAIQSAIQTRVFPIVQRHFMNNNDDNDEESSVEVSRDDKMKDDEWDLHIYDSLFIRYNATAAGLVDKAMNSEEEEEVVVNNDQTMLITKGAGQPLHRDLGVVSVNIMLNDATEFDGGGTFFEEQLSQTGYDDSDADEEEEDETRLPLKPSHKRGHALFHYSNRRHAGAGTTSGVRDILVMFLSASRTNDRSHGVTVGSIHPIELGARIKEKSKTITSSHEGETKVASSIQALSFALSMQRTMLYREAMNSVENDGEAYHYLGTCLDTLSQSVMDEEKQQTGQNLALESIQIATTLIPNDGRLFNNQGLTLGKQQPVVDDMQIERSFERSLDIHLRCKAVSCDVQTNLESTALNYGLFLSNRDRWEDAIEVLDFIDFFGPYEDAMLDKLRSDAYRLREFCAKQCNAAPHSTLPIEAFPENAKAAYEKLKRWIGSSRKIF